MNFVPWAIIYLHRLIILEHCQALLKHHILYIRFFTWNETCKNWRSHGKQEKKIDWVRGIKIEYIKLTMHTLLVRTRFNNYKQNVSKAVCKTSKELHIKNFGSFFSAKNSWCKFTRKLVILFCAKGIMLFLRYHFTRKFELTFRITNQS